MPNYPRVQPAGDSALTVEFGGTIDPDTNDRVLFFEQAITTLEIPDIIEIVPTYRSLTVYFDPVHTDGTSLRKHLLELTTRLERHSASVGRRIEIPVLYGGDYGPDLPDVAANAGLSPREVITLHRSVEYRVYMLGFCPGFPYLGTVPEPIAVPRLPEPRMKVPAGSVGIAGSQTGVYPQESPGGWRLIGRTPLHLYDPHRTKPFLFAAGDRVRFVEISQQDYERLDAHGTLPR